MYNKYVFFLSYTRMIELRLEELVNCKKKWKDMHHLNRALWHKTHMAGTELS